MNSTTWTRRDWMIAFASLAWLLISILAISMLPFLLALIMAHLLAGMLGFVIQMTKRPWIFIWNPATTAMLVIHLVLGIFSLGAMIWDWAKIEDKF